MGNSAAGSQGPWLVAGFAALCCSGICRHSHSLLPLPFSRSARKDEALKATQLGAVPLLSCCPGLECFSTVLVAMGGTCQQMLLTAAARNCVIKHCNEKWIEQGLQTPSASKCLLWVPFLQPLFRGGMRDSGDAAEHQPLEGASNAPRADLGWILLLYR